MLQKSAGWNSANEALAELRACSGGLPTLLARVFDQLDQMASGLLVDELVYQHGQQEALQLQVDRLAVVASELGPKPWRNKNSWRPRQTKIVASDKRTRA